MNLNIYVASSWKNPFQYTVVQSLRRAGHGVYDFKEPPGRSGFSWRDIDPEWREWSPGEYKKALQHPFAKAGYEMDMGALVRADACVLVLPAGRSASFELGAAMMLGKACFVLYKSGVGSVAYNSLASSRFEAELMFREAVFTESIEELLLELQRDGYGVKYGPAARSLYADRPRPSFLGSPPLPHLTNEQLFPSAAKREEP